MSARSRAPAEKVRREVGMLQGVSIVELFGRRDEEVSIEVSEESLRRYGLTFDDIARAVRSTSVNVSAGRIRTELGDVPLTARSLADTKSEFESIVVRETPDGARITVGDVAMVKDGFEEVNFLATVNGKPAILVQVMSGDNMNVPAMSRAVKDVLGRERGLSLPPGIDDDDLGRPGDHVFGSHVHDPDATSLSPAWRWCS